MLDMERRTFESPMDWEYQDRGPVDPTSPFTHAGRTGSQSVFSSPSKADSRSNPFLGSKATSAFPAHPPQASSFQPKLSSKPTAPPFLNPAFTTPRKPFDDVGLSEASGAEDSPALTDLSDYPNDTPELDRFADVNIGSAVTPSKVDKTIRYGRSGISPKRHAPGRGEIRSRAFALTDPTRKRKRHIYDRDVGSAALRQQDNFDSDTEFERDPKGKHASRQKSGGFLASIFHAINEYPHTPYNLSQWLGFSAICLILLSAGYVLWGIISAVQSDLYNANEAARLELVSRSTECREQYTLNECSRRLPASRERCDEWYECMNQDPEAIMRIKVTVKQFADVINEFADSLSLKAVGLIVSTVMGTVFVAFMLLQYAPARQAPQPAHPQRSGSEFTMPTENNQGFFLVPMQTPQIQRRREVEEETDTDASPPHMRPLLPPTTPSGRRSPSKGHRSQSPTKYRRSPSKGY
ncbi:Nucleus export protein BRL1 [Paramyrothecium foliicola]|nr:Nucleus export protein BRL1 [Paramyrothecium foliicola]